jgi:hypothetical protein
MSNNPFEHRRLFCEKINMKEPKFKIRVNIFPGICFGVGFPMEYYTDMYITILCFSVSFKWRKR